MQRAFGELNMGAAEVDGLLRAAAAVLLLGNIRFVPQGDTGSAVDGSSRAALTVSCADIPFSAATKGKKERETSQSRASSLAGMRQ